MRKKLLLFAIASLTVTGLLWGPTATAEQACGNGSAEGTVEDDTVTETPTGGTVYAGDEDGERTNGNGYFGTGSDDGYVEVDGDSGDGYVIEGADGSGEQSSSVSIEEGVCNNNLQ